ncbi:MAG: right-handed parallel beta-helix repeat-containing protein, partial [Gemmataceae bacterium]|nr:right-handed parallel beta-helix repeat-containing protein [Gemmataceae bacterium]
MSADGSQILAHSIFGASGREVITDVAVAPDGGLAIVGMTTATGLATAGAEQEIRRGPEDGFLVRYDANGQVMFATYLGSKSIGGEFISSVAFDSHGRVYVAGGIKGNDFFDGQRGSVRFEVFGDPNFDLDEIGADPDRPDRPVASTFDAFVTRYDDTGSVTFTALIGGKEFEQVEDIAIALDGSIILVGKKGAPASAEQEKFPLVNALDTTPDSLSQSGFLVKLAPNGTSIVFSTYLGRVVGPIGATPEVAVDADGNSYVMGLELTSTTPGQPNVVSLPLTKINTSGDEVVYSRYFGARDFQGELDNSGQLIRGYLAVAPTGEASLGFQMVQSQGDGTPDDQVQRISHNGERVQAVTLSQSGLGAASAFGVAGHSVVFASNIRRLGPGNQLRPVEAEITTYQHLLVNSNLDQSNASADPNVVDIDLDTPGAQISLRAALDYARQRSGRDVILIDLAGMYNENASLGSFVLELTNPLDVIDHRVTIVGLPTGTPEVLLEKRARLTLDGAGSDGLRFVGDGANGDTLPNPDTSGAGSRVSGLALLNFSGFGVRVDTDRIILDDLHIGANSGGGVRITGNGNTIANSLISDNRGVGVRITESDGNTIDSNIIGLDLDRTVPLGNDRAGVVIEGGSGHYVGGNIIADNGGHGIDVENISDSFIQSNKVGARLENGTYVGNQGNGIRAINVADTTIFFNTVIKNQGDGILIQTPSGFSDIAFNFVGIHRSEDHTVETAAGNAGVGIRLSGGVEQTIFRNTVGDNGGSGIRIEGGSANYVGGNRIGVGVTLVDDVYQLQAMGNGQHGIQIIDSHNNQIGFYNSPFFDFVDVNLDGIDDETHLPIFIIDGVDNIIGGNTGAGVHVTGTSAGNAIEGNSIGYVKGLESGATGVVANGTGVLLDNVSNNFVKSNVISGNTGAGIQIQGLNAFANELQGNFIGLEGFQEVIDFYYDPENFQQLGNGTAGILLMDSTHDNLIGGVDYFGKEANRIAFNGQGGIVVIDDGTDRNRLRGNIIQLNNGLAIDLGFDGVTFNDAFDQDLGPNSRQNHPDIQSVEHTPDETIVRGRLIGKPNEIYRIDFYDQDSLFYLGTLLVQPDDTGVSGFQVSFEGFRELITATATDSAGNTSEFSPLTIIVNRSGDERDLFDDALLDVDPDTQGLQVTLRAALEFANSRAGAERILFNLAEGDRSIQPQPALPFFDGPVQIDGELDAGQASITILGSQAGQANGLVFTANAAGASISNLNIGGFALNGIAYLRPENSTLRLDHVNVGFNGLWGVNAVGNVELANSSIVANFGGVLSQRGSVNVRNGMISANTTFGIQARHGVTLQGTAESQAPGVTISGNGGHGVYSLAGIVLEGANANHEIRGNEGAGIVALGFVNPAAGEGSGGPGVIINASANITQNSLDGVRSTHDVLLGPGVAVSVSENGRGETAREYDGEIEVTPELVDLSGDAAFGHGIVSHRGFVGSDVSPVLIVANSNDGAGILALKAIDLTVNNRLLPVENNKGPGLHGESGQVTL